MGRSLTQSDIDECNADWETCTWAGMYTSSDPSNDPTQADLARCCLDPECKNVTCLPKYQALLESGDLIPYKDQVLTTEQYIEARNRDDSFFGTWTGDNVIAWLPVFAVMIVVAILAFKNKR